MSMLLRSFDEPALEKTPDPLFFLQMKLGAASRHFVGTRAGG